MRIPQSVILPIGYRQIDSFTDQEKDYIKRLLIAITDFYRDIAGAVNLNDSYMQRGALADRPTASKKVRGVIYYSEAGAAAADSIDICMKSAADTYSWVNIATG